MSRLLRRRGFALLPLVCLALAGALLEASQVRSLNLEEMAGRADRIFAGRCLSVRSVPHPQLGSVDRVAFEVEQPIKGHLGSRLTIQVVSSGQDLPGSTRFTPGERVVLFLYADSALGLTSPVALGQGRFSIVTDKHGRSVALNPRGAGPLVQGLSAPARERLGAMAGRWEGETGVPLSELIDGTRALLDVRGASGAPAHGNPGAGPP
jgi:hypothetical protein